MQPKFIAFAAVAVALIVLLIVLLSGGGKQKDVTVQPQATPTVAPQSGVKDNVTISSSGNDLLSDPSTTEAPVQSADNPSTLAALLADEDAQVAALDKSLQLDVKELDINPDLPDTWLNVLLLGTDERYLDQNSRTDTMIICSINKTTGEVKLSSIMRDTAIVVSGVSKKYDGTYRINAANYFGGPKYAIKTVNQCLDLNIQHYVLVNFFGFQKIAQALGGVTLDITEAEMKEINVRAVEQAWAGYYAGVNEDDLLEANVYLKTYGPNTHLNGRQTLAYARIRKLDSDASRTGRQQRVLQALLDQLRTKSVVEVMALGASLFSNVQTNMSLNDVLEIANVVLQSGSLELETMRLPVNGSYKQESRNEQAMLYDTDWEHNTLELYNFIYG